MLASSVMYRCVSHLIASHKCGVHLMWRTVSQTKTWQTHNLLLKMNFRVVLSGPKGLLPKTSTWGRQLTQYPCYLCCLLLPLLLSFKGEKKGVVVGSGGGTGVKWSAGVPSSHWKVIDFPELHNKTVFVLKGHIRVLMSKRKSSICLNQQENAGVHV